MLCWLAFGEHKALRGGIQFQKVIDGIRGDLHLMYWVGGWEWATLNEVCHSLTPPPTPSPGLWTPGVATR